MTAFFTPGIWWNTRGSVIEALDQREPFPPDIDYTSDYPSYGRGFNDKTHQHRNEHDEGQMVLSPLSVIIAGKILRSFAEINVQHTFYNRTDTALRQASCSFFVPEGWAVAKFQCRVGTQKAMRALVETEREAHNTFQQAASRGQTAGLFNQPQANEFAAVVGNIPARTKVKMTISLITRLQITADSHTKLILPMCLAPRRTNPPARGCQYTALTNLPQQISIKIEISRGLNSPKISSPSHEINIEKKAPVRKAQSWSDLVSSGPRIVSDTTTVTWQSSPDLLDRDFVLEMVEEETPKIQAFREAHPDKEGQHALMINIPPIFSMKKAHLMSCGEIIFLTDCSGSMTDKMEALISMMKFLLKGILVGWKFNIWRFGSRQESLWPYSHDYSNQSQELALAYLKTTLRPNLEGSNLLPALIEILNRQDRLQPTEIILITDGKLWYMENILQYLRQARQEDDKMRLFVIGLGADVVQKDIERIAFAGGGYAEVVETIAHCGGEEAAIHMMRAALSVHMNMASIELMTATSNIFTVNSGPPTWNIRQSPQKISTLGAFFHTHVFLLLNACDSSETLETLTIKYKGVTEPEDSVDILIESSEHSDMLIHTLAARAVVGDLEQEYDTTAMSKRTSWLEQQDRLHFLKSEAEKIACEWSLVSRWTTLLLTRPPEAEARLSGEQLGVRKMTLGLLRARRQAPTTIEPMNSSVQPIIEQHEAGFPESPPGRRRKRARIESQEIIGSYGEEPVGAMSQRANEYFLPRDGIDRVVITADIQRWLGPDALVRTGTWVNPSTGQEVQGYYIEAYRNLTTAMVEDLKADSARWEQERRRTPQESQTPGVENRTSATSQILPDRGRSRALQGGYLYAGYSSRMPSAPDVTSHSRAPGNSSGYVAAPAPRIAYERDMYYPTNLRPQDRLGTDAFYARSAPPYPGTGTGGSATQPYVAGANFSTHTDSRLQDHRRRVDTTEPIRVPSMPRRPTGDESRTDYQKLQNPSTSILDDMHALSISSDRAYKQRVKSPERLRREATVKRLLSAQSYDGAFSPQTADTIGSPPGEALTAAVAAFSESRECPADSTAARLVAWTVVVMAWLERDFEVCQQLWQLIRVKADDFLRRNANWNSEEGREAWASAREALPATMILTVDGYSLSGLYDEYLA
ncbi:von Willebrand factor type A domain-containing protein [Xylariomycetidae sp. FL2044]|nr:von Willebrand factor type A domain-containing protein [Xylariomycetidae sp. FL2044]